MRGLSNVEMPWGVEEDYVDFMPMLCDSLKKIDLCSRHEREF